MPKGVLGIEAVDPFVSTKPDLIPATAEKAFPHPRHRAIAVVPNWESPVLDEQGNFVRFPIRANAQMEMGQWGQTGFQSGPGPVRVWETMDVCRPEMLAKYPNLEASLLYLISVVNQEAAESGVI